MLRISLQRASAIISAILSVAIVSQAQQPAQAPAPEPGTAAALVQQGQKLSHEGKQDEALALYRQALERNPNSYEAELGSGMALDLKGEYAEAREHFTKALEMAPADNKAQVQRAMAISYIFEGNPFKASESEMLVFNARLAKNDSVGAAEICTELARMYLETGDPDHAYKWYKMGYETVAHKPELTDADKNLWLFRWESAQARVAARRGQADEAKQHLAAAKVALDKANNPDQLRFYPYLTGYVAFYLGDYKTAIGELQKADQHDALILALLAQSYEKSGNAAQAKAYYGKVMESNGHSLNTAVARPLAAKKLAGGS